MLPNEDTSVNRDHKSNKNSSIQFQYFTAILQQKLMRGIRSLFLPLQIRNYFLLFSGQLASTFGDAFYTVALPFLILTNGGSTVELGTVLAVYGIPRIGTSLIGGWLSDKFKPRWIMLGTDIFRALLIAILAVLAIIGHPALWQLCAIGAPLGALSGAFLPAYYAMTPEILPEDALQSGNALSSSSLQFAELLGPSIAGIVVSIVSSGVAFMIDAFSFVISIITLVAMRKTETSFSTKEAAEVSINSMEIKLDLGTPIVPEASYTSNTSSKKLPTITNRQQSIWEILRQSRLLQVSLTITVVVNIMLPGAMEVALPKLTQGPLAGGSVAYGLLLAAFSAGAIIGSLSASTLGKLPHRGLIALVIGLVQAGAYTLVPLTYTVIGAAIFLVIAGLATGVNNVFYITILQQKLPRHLLGRIMGIMMLCANGLYPLSTVLGGFVTQRYGSSLMFFLVGITLTMAFSYGFLWPEYRHL